MVPSLTVGLVLVLLVIIAGGAEIWSQHRRNAQTRDRFRREYASAARDLDRLRRAEFVLESRRDRLEDLRWRPEPPTVSPLPAIMTDAPADVLAADEPLAANG